MGPSHEPDVKALLAEQVMDVGFQGAKIPFDIVCDSPSSAVVSASRLPGCRSEWGYEKATDSAIEFPLAVRGGDRGRTSIR